MKTSCHTPLTQSPPLMWERSFADRTRWMRRSAIRELLRLTAQPDFISLAGGLPAPELFPSEPIQIATDAVLRRRALSALQYGETEGFALLREWIANCFRPAFARIGVENILITSGAQQAIDLIGRVFLDPGDRVLVENPTYLAALGAWRPLGVEFVGMRTDADGIRVDDLTASLARRPKLAYCVPNFQNPKGTTLSLDRRIEIAELLRRREVILVEDNPYGDLRYTGTDLPHLTGSASRDLHCECGCYVGTFSKILAPGLRIGWVIAAEPVIRMLAMAKQSADLHTSTYCQHIVYEVVASGFLEGHIPKLRATYKQRMDALLSALARHFPTGVTWTQPLGGMFLLVTLPESVSADALLKHALARKVAFVPGEEFHLNGQGANTLRLNFTNAPPHLLQEGVKRLAEALSAAQAEIDRDPQLVPGTSRM